MFKISWDLCVLIMGLDLLDGCVLHGKPEDLEKTDAIACAILEGLCQRGS